MDIKKAHLQFTSLSKRSQTKYIIIHHTASTSDMTVESIHQQHLNQGWAGIGYNLYINKKGEIWEGRPVEMSGAQCEGFNSSSVGVCLSGNFEIEEPNQKQITALKEVIKYLKGKYPNACIVGHRDLKTTACPGKNLYSQLGSVIANSIIQDEYVKVFMTNNKLSVVQSNGKKFTYNIPKGTTKDDFIADLAHGLKITN